MLAVRNVLIETAQMTIKIGSQKRKIGFWVTLISSIFAGWIVAMANEPTREDLGAPESEKVAIADNESIKNRPIKTMTRGYTSSDSCQECHAQHYGSWHASHHRTMTQVPTKDSVIADFDDKVLVHSGRRFRFFQEDDEYFMELKASDPSATDKPTSGRVFKIVLMTGAHHQQGFWCETDRGRTLAKIPFIWITKEERWIPYGSIFFLPSSGLSMHAGAWNSNLSLIHI